jgi:transposase, IS5 family
LAERPSHPVAHHLVGNGAEPHTDLIKRGKVRTPVEFGHKVFLAESGIGLITRYEVLQGNPVDEIHVIRLLQHHHRVFRRSPKVYSTDRGFFSEENVEGSVNGGVTTSIPQARAARRRNAKPTNDRAHLKTASAFALA